jgi:hypothetical protein
MQARNHDGNGMARIRMCHTNPSTKMAPDWGKHHSGLMQNAGSLLPPFSAAKGNVV